MSAWLCWKIAAMTDPTDTEAEELSPADLAAFELAIATARRDPTEARWIDDRLASGRDRVEIGKSAAYHCQIVSLGLLPWEIPPCYAMARPAVYDHQRASRRLLGRMLDAGVSKWHPDPVRECERIEAERQAAR